MTIYQETLYQDLVNDGVQTIANQTNLYFEITEKSLAIFKKYPDQAKKSRSFFSEIDHTPWMDIPLRMET